ncbi:MAG: DUF4870 domain-containing protein [Vicinamibacterales bacterium]
MADPVPPIPPSGGPPPPPPPPPPTSGPPSGNRNVMIVLSYLWLLALVPLVLEKDDKEVQWHARHGLVLLIAELIVWVLLSVLTSLGPVGCIFALLYPILVLVFLGVHIVAIMKGVNGQRFRVPYVTEFADRL